MSKSKWLIVLAFSALCGQGPYAQNTMSIEEMFRLADENSQSIRLHRTELEAAQEALLAAKRERLPDISASVSGSYWGNGTLWDRNFKNQSSVPMPHWGNNFALEALQVVYAGGAVKSDIRIAELAENKALLNWQLDRQEILFLLTGHYLDLYKLDNQILVLQKNLELTDQVIANMIARRNQGTALKNDITRYELQREQLKLQLAQIEDARKIANHRLVTTLHLPEDTRIRPDTALLAGQIEVWNETYWQNAAAEHNLGIQQALTDIEISEQKVRLERAERRPQVAIMVSEHLDGPITIEVPVLNNNFNYWFVGIGVSYNIASLFKNSRKVRQAKLNVQRAREAYALSREQINNDVQAGYVNFLTAFTELHTQENSVKLANENYDVTNNRYKNEMALLTDMLDASNMKLSADLGLVNARINVIYNYYKMKYITHTL